MLGHTASTFATCLEMIEYCIINYFERDSENFLLNSTSVNKEYVLDDRALLLFRKTAEQTFQETLHDAIGILYVEFKTTPQLTEVLTLFTNFDYKPYWRKDKQNQVHISVENGKKNAI